MDPIMIVSLAEMLFDFAVKERGILMQKTEWTAEQEASWKDRTARYMASAAWKTAAEEAAGPGEGL